MDIIKNTQLQFDKTTAIHPIINLNVPPLLTYLISESKPPRGKPVIAGNFTTSAEKMRIVIRPIQDKHLSLRSLPISANWLHLATTRGSGLGNYDCLKTANPWEMCCLRYADVF
ncbi:hypothetical protein CEXT_623021 [Caerostris extrusa]|uniref:Uncharacterized protein n=1 Tax=Caerostris extrusa TaxID=172846 RepID=A0AAV4VCR2_CAEEX|nr:hypothetical protein CEXT_623021 [Caerostris extrusa]